MSPNPAHISTPGALHALELLPMPVVIVDDAYRFIHYNGAFRIFLQLTDPVLPIHTLTGLFPGLTTALAAAGGAQQERVSVVRGVKALAGERYFDLYVSQNAPEISVLQGYTITCIEVTDVHPEVLKMMELGEHHRQFLSLTTTGVVIHRNGIVVYANKTANHMVGYTGAETIVGLPIWDFVPEAYRSIVAERIRNSLSNVQPAPPLEERFIRRDGSEFDVEVFAFAVTYDGAPAIKTFITDISARKEADRKLIAGQQQYFNLVENLTDVVFQTDTEGRFTFLNNVWEQMSGYAISETLGESCYTYVHHPHNTELFSLKVRKLMQYGIRDFQYDLLLSIRNGAPRYVEVSVKPLKDAKGVITGINGVIRDIHAKKMTDLEVRKIQKTLKEHQQILTSLTKEESIINGDFSTALARIAQVTAETLGVSRVNIWRFASGYQMLEGQVNYDRVTDQFEGVQTFHVQQFPHYFDTLLQRRILVADDVISDERFREFHDVYIRPEQIISMMDVAISSGDDLWGVICLESRHAYHKWSLEDQSFARSIADFIALAHKSAMLQATQSALLETENQYRSLIEQARDAVMMIDKDDRFMDVNEAACAIAGYSRDEFLRMSVVDLIPERLRKYYTKPTLHSREIKYFFGERIFRHKDGRERIAEISAHVFPDGRMQGIARDVTERKEQEKALQESETRLDLALKGADMGIWDFYIQENRMVHNKRWAEMLGYFFEHTEVTEQYWEKFVHPDDKELAYRAFDLHIKGLKPFYEAEIRMLASNGEWKWILDKGKIVEWDRSGKPIRASGIHQDITHVKSYQQQLMHQKAFLQEMVDAIPNIIYVKNAAQEFVTVNSAFAQLLNTTPEQIVSNTTETFDDLYASIQELTARDSEVFYTKKPVIQEAVAYMHAGTGKPIWLQTIKVPLADAHGDLTYVLSVSADVTELKLKENEIIRLNDQLELKVAERTNALEAANKELETFNYSVSHDLRTPLRSIDIFAYLLEKNYLEKLDKDGVENIRQIRRSVVKMSNLIDNLLIFSKMGRSDKRNELVSVARLTEEIIEDIGSQEDLSVYDIRVRELPVVRGDQAMLRQAMTNLIGNAIKYSRSKKRPVVEIYSYPDPGWHTVAIRDNGVGFSSDLRDKLFKAFKRLHSDEKFEGSGVGLAIVERIVKRHNGRVWAESKEGRGSTFYFSIPAVPEDNRSDVS